MKPDDTVAERLLLLLDGRVTAEERRGLEQELREEPQTRAALRTLAEEAVLFADAERTAAARRADPTVVPFPRPTPRIWRWAAAALVVLGIGAAGLWLRPSGGRELARVIRVTGTSGVFGARGAAEQPLPPGVRLRAGDMIETRSCDAWVELELRDGSRLTVAGHSALRLLESSPAGGRVNLLRGNLWHSPAAKAGSAQLVVQTPTSVVEAGQAQFDLQATAVETILRVNQGRAQVRHPLQSDPVEVAGGFQASVELSAQAPPVATPQPAPVSTWQCNLDESTAVILGRWLPSGTFGTNRLGAVPLLWPLPDRPPVLLHAVSLSPFQTVGRPLELRAEAHVRFEGRTLRDKTVRFGFSTQRMRGVFAGKFEVDVPPARLGPAGDRWMVDLPVTAFRPLHPELSSSPAGLELTDLYALTVIDDAGLEIHRIEVVLP